MQQRISSTPYLRAARNSFPCNFEIVQQTLESASRHLLLTDHRPPEHGTPGNLVGPEVYHLSGVDNPVMLPVALPVASTRDGLACQLVATGEFCTSLDIRPRGVDGQRKCPAKWPAEMSLVLLAMITDGSYPPRIELHGRAHGFHVFLRRVPKDPVRPFESTTPCAWPSEQRSTLPSEVEWASYLTCQGPCGL